MHDGTRTAGRPRRTAPAVGSGRYPARALTAALTLLCCCLLTALAAAPAGAARTAPHPHPRPLTDGEARTDAYLASVRDQAPDSRSLRRFFLALPKGGDLHNHLFGAVRTEYLIALAGQEGLCIDTVTLTAVVAPCGPGTRPAADARGDRDFREAILRAWSMYGFPPNRSGHDHFFATFDKFGLVPALHPGKVLAEVADSVAAQHQSYLETMVNPASDRAERLADEVGWDPDPAALHARLVEGGRLDEVVDEARRATDASDAEFRAAARCGTAHPRPGCRLTVRFVYQAFRGDSRARVFTELALGMRLAERDPRFLAVNLVQPEDGPVALADYTEQMDMVSYLHTVYPRAHVTLHAGELRPGLVPPEDLRFHIREAVGIAGAERVGHGVDLRHEDDWQRTARTMAARQTAVEVPFTSNAQILGVRGAAHPFDTYRAYRVPVVLATDDPGVSRTDISHEYRYAAETYGLTYPELKDLARASLEYAFLPGRSLWRGNPTRDGYRPVAACAGQLPGGGRAPSGECRQLLGASPKAAVQWLQETASAAFERAFGRGSASD
ncbi:adenosine deaminase family protein [Streptomyces fuscichromogenes]|uniref:adenosine deaminase family protein n=1 Tax=Streptomyces fuscichromogenes TaxID=1324013 RepID=UPI00357137C0